MTERRGRGSGLVGSAGFSRSSGNRCQPALPATSEAGRGRSAPCPSLFRPSAMGLHFRTAVTCYRFLFRNRRRVSNGSECRRRRGEDSRSRKSNPDYSRRPERGRVRHCRNCATVAGGWNAPAWVQSAASDRSSGRASGCLFRPTISRIIRAKAATGRRTPRMQLVAQPSGSLVWGLACAALLRTKFGVAMGRPVGSDDRSVPP
jgi:hypothetical protein